MGFFLYFILIFCIFLKNNTLYHAGTVNHKEKDFQPKF